MTPDLKRFPTWNESLRSDMKQKHSFFLRDFMPLLGSRNHPSHGSSAEPMTYLSPTLAKHYGMDGPGPDVPGTDDAAGDTAHRTFDTRECLDHDFLSGTDFSGQARQGILEQLPCSPPPPPPGVSTDLTAMMGNGTLRQSWKPTVRNQSARAVTFDGSAGFWPGVLLMQ